MHHRHTDIYSSRWHLVAAFLLIFVPLLYLLIFSYLTHEEHASLFRSLTVSAGRLAIAYVIAAALAWVCATAFYHGRRGAVALPIFDVLQSFPTFAMLPLITLVWGISNVTVIFFLVVTVVWPLFFSIISSLKQVNREWREAAVMARLGGWQYLRLFLIPVTLPGLITGSIVGLGEGWEALIATEIIVGIKSGLGVFFQAHAHNPSITALGVVGLLAVIFSINKLLWLPLLEWSHRLTGQR